MKANVYFIATYDTKGIESAFIKEKVEKYGANCITVDVGVGGAPTATPDVPLCELCRGTEYTVDAIHAMPRGKAVEVASDLVEQYIHKKFYYFMKIPQNMYFIFHLKQIRI